MPEVFPQIPMRYYLEVIDGDTRRVLRRFFGDDGKPSDKLTPICQCDKSEPVETSTGNICKFCSLGIIREGEIIYKNTTIV